MRRVRIILPVILLLTVSFLFSSAFSLAPVTVTLDAEKDPLYLVITADALLDAYRENKTSAGLTYDKQLLAVYGQIGSVDEKGDSFSLVSSQGTEMIRCTVSGTGLRRQAAGQKAGAQVCVLGRIRLTTLPREQWTLTVAGIEAAAGSIPTGEVWRSASGAVVRKTDRAEKGFGTDKIRGGARVTCSVPRSFLSVEEELPNTEGFLYRLNELPGEKKTQPEQLYLFYFDNETMLQDQNDVRRTTKIEEAIIKNILPGENIGFGKFPKRHSAYEHPFQYYDTGYDGYHAEFAFTPAGEDGIFCVLYVYRSSEHLRDILTIFRFLEIK